MSGSLYHPSYGNLVKLYTDEDGALCMIGNSRDCQTIHNHYMALAKKHLQQSSKTVSYTHLTLPTKA